MKNIDAWYEEAVREYIKEQIRKSGWSQRRLSMELGYSQSHLSFMLSGRAHLSDPVLKFFGFERRTIFVRKEPE